MEQNQEVKQDLQQLSRHAEKQRVNEEHHTYRSVKTSGAVQTHF